VAIQLLRRVRRDDALTGLSAARASALSVLVFGGPRTIGELAAAEQVTAPTMTRLVAGLEAEGYVTRKADRTDRRAVQLSATAKGRRALEAGRHRRVQHVLELLAGLDAGEEAVVAEAVELLERVLSRESETRRRS
jgi:DNA-binding MarR family transcriptional regulator